MRRAKGVVIGEWYPSLWRTLVPNQWGVASVSWPASFSKNGRLQTDPDGICPLDRTVEKARTTQLKLTVNPSIDDRGVDCVQRRDVTR